VTRIQIAVATRTDLPRLLEIRHAAFLRHAPSAYSPEEVETLLRDVDEGELLEMIADARIFVARKADGVAREGDAVVGLAGWRGARLRHVYVDPDQTRQGIASALLRHVEADFRRRTRGGWELKANVVLYAAAFYLANGYRLIGRAKAWDGSEYFEMVKTLDGD
jgi:ribosomal protein S18 acetylase RimI-like enzyme